MPELPAVCVVRSGPPGAVFLPLYMGAEAGLYDKHGLACDFGFIRGSAQAAEDLSDGRVHVSAISLEGLVEASQRGHSLVFVAGGTNAFLFGLWARRELHTMADLRGKRLGIANLGSTTHFALRLALDHLGGAEADVVPVEAGNASRLQGLKAGAFDAAILSPPDSFLAREAGLQLLVDLSQLGLAYPQGGLATARRTLQTSRDTIKRFLKAYVESLHLGRTDGALVRSLAARFLRTEEPAMLAACEEVLRGCFQPLPFASPLGMRRVLRLLGRDLDPEELVDNSLLQELEAEGFVGALDA